METKRSDPAAEGEPVLVVATPTGFSKQYRFGLADTLVAGREAAIAIPDDSVSRRHAEFRAIPLAVRDLGSTNGTRVQGVSVGGTWVELAYGSVVELGDTVILVRTSNAMGGVGDDMILPERRDDRPAPRMADDLVIGSAEMTRLCSLVELVAPSRLSVLIVGETGVGKELIARAVHRASPRRDERMLALNCAAIAPTLLESELFGFEKGSFTGATTTKPGLFEAASGGTVFLDEIGEMPLDAQAKLLRVLESGEVLRIGGRAPTQVDVRFVAATHRDLGALAQRGQFRLDLLFRISGVTLAIPPLRDRPQDIAALATAFLRKLRANDVGLTAAALDALQRHPWPGNVRELKSTIERAELLSRGGLIDVPHLTFGVGVALGAATVTVSAPASEPATFRDEVAALERDRILAALDACGGNQSRAAKQLGISRATLLRRLDVYGVTRPRK